jgi:hypothetical protein
MTERIRRQLEKIEALMDPPETMRVRVTVVYIGADGRPTGEVDRYPPEKDETKS